MHNMVWLCLSSTPYNYGVSGNISYGTSSATLRCLAKLVTQKFSSMILIIDPLTFLLRWFTTSCWNSLNQFKCFRLLPHQIGISAYIYSIDRRWYKNPPHTITHDGSHTSACMISNKLIARSIRPPNGISGHLPFRKVCKRQTIQQSNNSGIPTAWSSFMHLFLTWPKRRCHN